LEEVDPAVQRDIVFSLSKDRVAQLIGEMTPGQAADIAANGATAAAASNVSMVYANMLLSGQTPTNTTLLGVLQTAAYQNLGDYTAAYAAGNTGTVSILITVTAPANVTQPTANTTKTVVLVP
jgi:hypothetical protein